MRGKVPKADGGEPEVDGTPVVMLDMKHGKERIGLRFCDSWEKHSALTGGLLSLLVQRK